MALVALTSAGTLDPTFNPGGAVDARFPNGGQMVVTANSPGVDADLLVQGDGKILAVAPVGSNVGVFRFNPNGTPDAGFGTNGEVTIDQLVSPANSTEALDFQPGGKILVTGQAATGGFGVARLSPTGQLDTTLGNNGLLAVSLGGSNDQICTVAVDPATGAFLLVGTTNVGGVTQAALVGYNVDGTPNTSFGNNGVLTLPAPSIAGTTGGVSTRTFHPQLFDYAIAEFQSDGKVLISTGNQQIASIRRVQPVVQSFASTGVLGKHRLAPFTLANGTTVTITFHGGAGTETNIGNQVQLTVTGSPTITIKTKGGANAFSLGDITINGNLRMLIAPTASLDGILKATGTIGQLRFGSVTGVIQSAGGIASLTALGNVSGSISAAGVIGMLKLGQVSGTIAGSLIRNLTTAGLTDATILAGTNLGADGQLGGNDDAYGAGQINMMKVTGSIASSFIGAGVNPSDGLFGNGNDASAGAGSRIRMLTVKGSVDAATRIESGLFPKTVHIPAKVVPTLDARFVVLH